MILGVFGADKTVISTSVNSDGGMSGEDESLLAQPIWM